MPIRELVCTEGHQTEKFLQGARDKRVMSGKTVPCSQEIDKSRFPAHARMQSRVTCGYPAKLKPGVSLSSSRRTFYVDSRHQYEDQLARAKRQLTKKKGKH